MFGKHDETKLFLQESYDVKKSALKKYIAIHSGVKRYKQVTSYLVNIIVVIIIIIITGYENNKFSDFTLYTYT